MAKNNLVSSFNHRTSTDTARLPACVHDYRSSLTGPSGNMHAGSMQAQYRPAQREQSFPLPAADTHSAIGMDVTEKLRELEIKLLRLTGAAEDMLSKAFIVSEDLAVSRESLDMRRDILDAVLDELSGELRQQKILIYNRLAASGGRRFFIKASKFWVRAAFRNLLKNAVQYGGRGCTIVIGCEDHGVYYLFNVYNSGRPVKEAYRDNLFKKWKRGSLSNNGVGLGLGLYLTKEVIQKHGGCIWYESLGYGSNFLFTLPRE
jgi:two-component system sensor histidine kinase VicK